MTYKEKYNKVVATDVETVLKSGELTLYLLSLYSKLFLGGTAPHGCSKCLRDYYEKIKETSTEKLDEMDKKKTCKLKPGVHYIAKLQKHVMDSTMTDELANDLLAKKAISEKLFIKLPEKPEKKAPAKEKEADEQKGKESGEQKGKATTSKNDFNPKS